MVQYCWVLGCKNHSNRTDIRKISYFSIPAENPDRLQQWLYKIGRLSFATKPIQYLKYKRICSEHFERTALGISLCKLKSNAEPTIFEPKCGYKGVVMGHDAEPGSSVTSSQENEQPEKENNSPNTSIDVKQEVDDIDIQDEKLSMDFFSKETLSQWTQTPPSLAYTPREIRLQKDMRNLQRRNIRLKQSLNRKPNITEKQFIDFGREKLGERMGNFLKAQLKFAKSKGKDS